MAHKLGKKDSCKAFSRKQKGKVTHRVHVGEENQFPLNFSCISVCAFHLRRVSLFGWQEESVQHSVASESAPREENP